MITASLAVPSQPYCGRPSPSASTKNATSKTLATTPATPETNAQVIGALVRGGDGRTSVSMPARLAGEVSRCHGTMSRSAQDSANTRPEPVEHAP